MTGEQNRREALLAKAAEAMGDGIDPFHVLWLSEHEVTIDEAYDLSDDLATGARLLLRLKADLRTGGLAATVAVHRLVDGLARG